MNSDKYKRWIDALANGEDVRWNEFEADEEQITSNSVDERGRTVRYGRKGDFEQYSKTVHAKEVKNSGNKIFVDNSVQLTRKEIRNLDSMISKAKELHGVNNTCNAPFVITDNAGRIASYNPRTNTFFVDYRLVDPDKVIEQQQGFAAPDNIYSTMVHEIFHWKDAEDYRSAGNNIDRADFKSQYSQYNRNVAKNELKSAGIDISNPAVIAEISQYAFLKWLENDLEEVYTEYRTKELLKE